jgi:hypothetical protein
MQCSTSGYPSVNSGGVGDCSAYQAPGSTPVKGGNNTICSALLSSGSYCSTGPNGAQGGAGATNTCSTAGGVTVPGSTDGAVGCSAGGIQTPANPPAAEQSCSTQGNAAPPAGQSAVGCSSFAGEHQACSSGAQGPGNSAFCSAVAGATAGTNKCSSMNDAPANNPPNNTHYANLCSAINMPYTDKQTGNATDTGNHGCSVMATAGSQSTDACSVQADAQGNAPGNAACTSIVAGVDTNNGAGQFVCSAVTRDGKGGYTGAAGNCSVMSTDNPPKVTGPDPKTGLCGNIGGSEYNPPARHYVPASP